ncbi:MAG TPA: hypothetical protein VHT51_14600 [Micropepsaceae bacterium]|nr:hypothetical protein [Micropepsaceae bacterium]
MIGSINYPTPILVNGYSCKNCTDVDLAKKHIDPDHPKAGPFGINAQNDPALKRQPGVTFGGSLSNLNATHQTRTNLLAPGGNVDLLA